MAVDYCHTCGDYRDLDWEDSYWLVNDEYRCHNCCTVTLTEAELEFVDYTGEVEIGRVVKRYHHEYGGDVWQPEVGGRDPGAFIEPEVDQQKAFDKWWQWREDHPPVLPEEDDGQPDERQEWYDFDPEC